MMIYLEKKKTYKRNWVISNQNETRVSRLRKKTIHIEHSLLR